MLGKYQILTNTHSYLRLFHTVHQAGDIKSKKKDLLLTFIDRFYLHCLHSHHIMRLRTIEIQNTFVITSHYSRSSMHWPRICLTWETFCLSVVPSKWIKLQVLTLILLFTYHQSSQFSICRPPPQFCTRNWILMTDSPVLGRVSQCEVAANNTSWCSMKTKTNNNLILLAEHTPPPPPPFPDHLRRSESNSEAVKLHFSLD